MAEIEDSVTPTARITSAAAALTWGAVHSCGGERVTEI